MIDNKKKYGYYISMGGAIFYEVGTQINNNVESYL